ncbi:MAG: type II secretion system minor pseudopilin GspK [Caulobacterales bacterium]|nr:type II secretion system minor pseudopilin GspK [Caulobacterales bacterium]
MLTVLLLVAVMSAAASAMLDDMRFTVKRSANATAREQALWYALGAEEMARQVIWRSWRASPTRSTMIEPWAIAALLQPIPGGRIEGAVRDGGNCFNLNGLTRTAGPLNFAVSSDGVRLMTGLLTTLGLTVADAQILADSVADYIDTDDSPNGRGAEDYEYVTRTPPRRAANTRMVDVQELRAVRGVSQELYQALRPYMCALPSDRALHLNVNTLQENDAVLVAAAFEDRLSEGDARLLIAERPADGFGTLSAFFETDIVSEIAVNEEIKSRFTERTEFFDLTARIHHHDAFVEVSATLSQDEQGELTLVRRRLGALE